MSLPTSTTIILDYIPYGPLAKTLSLSLQWRMKLVPHGFLLPNTYPRERPRDVNSRREPCWL